MMDSGGGCSLHGALFYWPLIVQPGKRRLQTQPPRALTILRCRAVPYNKQPPTALRSRVDCTGHLLPYAGCPLASGPAFAPGQRPSHPVARVGARVD